MKVAVVGAGISGLASAHFLQQRHAVSLFEQDARAGGHTNTVRVPRSGGGEQPVDTGWIVYNEPCYPNLSALFVDLGITTRPTRMSFAVSLGDGACEWKGSDALWPVFAQPSNLLRASHWRMLRDILRLNRACAARLARGDLPAGSLGGFLDAEGFGHELRSRYLLPMAGMIWSCSPRRAAEYPAADFMRFFAAHGLFTAVSQPQWRTVVGGSDAYVKKLLAAFRGTPRLATPVRALRREAGGVTLATDAGAERFDRVVCAVHADQALALLAGPEPLEARVLSGIPYHESRCVLHTDASFLPRRRAARACWNYLHESDEIHDGPVCGSYWMNALQGIEGPVDYVVTLNPRREIPRERILYETRYAHPFYGAGSVATHALLPQIQGRGGMVWAGAWTGYGFHEDGLTSALEAVRRIDPECLPSWAVTPAKATTVTPAKAGVQCLGPAGGKALDSGFRRNDEAAPRNDEAPAGVLYPARVMHRRLTAPLYRFVYRLFYLLLDVDRIGELDRQLRCFSRNRFNLVSFHDRDHGDGATPLRAWAERLLGRAGIALDGGRIRLLCLPRVLGFGFNPISLWYCEHRDGSLRAVIAEVRNTFGEKHCYLLAAGGRAISYEGPHEKAKGFHVSPLLDLVGRYWFRLSEPGERVRVRIHEEREGVPILDATLAGARVPLSDRTLLAQVAAMPWMTLKVVAAIHWEALKIWLRGARFHRKPAPPAPEYT